MENNQKKKILVCGDVRGQFNDLFERIDSIQKTKGEFDVLLCLGKFFGEDSTSLEPYITGEKKIPVPTYFITTHADKDFLVECSDGGEICEGITYLGQQGIKSIKGLQIGFLSATHDHTKKNKPMDYDPTAIKNIVAQVQNIQFKGIDIFLTNEWPKGILNCLSDEFCPKGISMLEYDDFGADVVSQVTSAFAPRYHFTSSPSKNIFFERSPYRNGPQYPSQRNFAVTRFFSLGDCFNTKKQRFLYAFSIQALNGIHPTELYEQPPHTTDFPFHKFCYSEPEQPPPKRQKTEEKPLPDLDKARFDGEFIDNTKPNYAQRKNFRNRSQIKFSVESRGRDHCWFCMSNSACEIHLIISVGKHFYLAISKGGLNDAHVLIVPVKHLPNQLTFPEDAKEELKIWIKTLQKFFLDRGEDTVLYEHSFPGPNQHCHIQVVPIPTIEKNRVKDIFSVEGKKVKLDWLPLGSNIDLSSQLSSTFPYFWVLLQDGTQMVAQIEDKIPFSFGRRVLSILFGHPELEDWKKCVQAKLVEEKMTKDFRDAFKPYQFM